MTYQRRTRDVERFRKGLLAVAVVQLVLGVGGVVFGIAGAGVAIPTTVIGGIIASVVVSASLPLVAGLLISRRPTAGWYLGMGVCALQLVLSLLSLPVGLVTMAIYGALAYFGYNGRPALETVYGDATASETLATEATESPTDAMPDVETAAATADAKATESTSPPPGPSTSGDPPVSETPAASDSTGTATAAESGDEPATAAADPADGAEDEQAPASTTSADTAEPTTESAGDTTDEPAAESAETESTADTDTDAVDAEYGDALTADSAKTRADAVKDLAAAASEEAVPSQAAIDAIVDRLDDDEPDVRAAACDALGRLGADRAEPALEDLRIDPDRDVSRAASRALRQLE